MSSDNDLIIRYLGVVDYQTTWKEMVDYTQKRSASSPDEVWICQHPPVFTAGTSVKSAPRFFHTIPCISTDRGGKLTYHGPGQLLCYPLFDLRRRSIYPKDFLLRLENIVISLLKEFDLESVTVAGAPGIYVHKPGGTEPFKNLAKISSIGLKISKHCTYHGFALNVSMDTSPFKLIDPCGYKDLRLVNLSDFVSDAELSLVAEILKTKIKDYFCD